MIQNISNSVSTTEEVSSEFHGAVGHTAAYYTIYTSRDDKRQVLIISGWNLKYFTIQRVQYQLQTCPGSFGHFLLDKKNGSPLRRVEAK